MRANHPLETQTRAMLCSDANGRNMRHRVTLEVHENKKEDVYCDRVRIPEGFRGSVREGRICKISVEGKGGLLEIRGILDEPRGIIRMDERTRRDVFGILTEKRYDFDIREAGWLGQFLWAWEASDSAARIAARLGLLGLILGVIGLGVALIPLFRGSW